MTDQLIIPAHFNGPPESANGGWFAGRLAGVLRAADAAITTVTVRLSAPPPLDVPMDVAVVDGGIELRAKDVRVATASASPDLSPPAITPVPYAVALGCGPAYEGLAKHPFPTCYSCGPARDDGLGLRPGRVPGGAGEYAAAWRPTEVSVENVWAALDCPGGWSAGIAGRPMVLGTITARVGALPDTDEECVVMAWPGPARRRRFASGSAVFGADGRLLGQAESVWIAVDPAAIRPR
ncbi:hypothetical protein [Nostocoides vanveenii]